MSIQLSKNQKRKLERYGIIPVPLKGIGDLPSSVFEQWLKHEEREPRKKIHKKPGDHARGRYFIRRKTIIPGIRAQ